MTAFDAQPHALTLRGVFEKALQKYADRTAVHVDGQSLTYAELDARANAVAHALAERGVGPNDRVALMMSNCLEYVIADLAIIKAGAAKIPLNDMLTASEFEYMLSDSGAGAVICGAGFVETLDGFRDSLPALETVIGIRDDEGTELPDGFEAFDELGGERSSPPSVDLSTDDVAGHFYTGGTTGKPKGVIHRQTGLTMNVYAHVTELGIDGDETLLLMTPLPHSAGMFLWAALLTGATSVIHAGFEPDTALSRIQSERVTWTFMVPTMIYRLLDHPELDAHETDSLDTLVYGAAPMTPARLREGLDEFGAVFLQFYGQTEVPNLITSFGKREHELAATEGPEERLSSAGQPCLMADVKIVDPESGESLPAGEEGEILATAPYAMDSYYERPEATDETVTDGWVHTGDIGRIDEDGYVYLLDRASNMIITGGMNVYSTEVEEALDEHEALTEVAVIGVPDDEWGEAVTAICVPQADADVSESDIKAFADDRLADYKKPKHVEFVDEIPKTPYGKMDKKALRDDYWADEDREIS
ncbi:class I adenylate-forming enzyme family protein [Natronomonas sp.]|uniref:class I adenylate-forming enzyme family protein n=1 Tax=Natronomonas sp. TaxID=2184060 RepID=UPI002FC27E4E